MAKPSPKTHAVVLSNSYHQIEVFGPLSEGEAGRLQRRVENETTVSAISVELKDPATLRQVMDSRKAMLAEMAD